MTLRIAVVLELRAGRADAGEQPQDCALRDARQADVERTEQPSTRAEMTATRLATASLFMS